VRDVNRKPAEIVAFAGVRPGMVVGELAPGRGYYTRILARTVGPGGKVYALVSKAQAARPGGLDAVNAVAAQYGNVIVLPVDYASLALPEKADLFWTTENYHDFHNGPAADISALNRAVLRALKPGGIYFVEDHRAKPGSGPGVTSTLHRIEEAQARREVTDAGFRLEASSDLLHNPADSDDTRNADTALAGRTDKFALRFRAPG
jgi:predicted methyltransferase